MALDPVLIKDPKKEIYIVRVVVALDVFVNVIFGGQAGETISTRCSKGAIAGNKFARFMVWWLNKVSPNHFQKAPAGDEERDAEAIANIEKETDVEPEIKK